MVTLVEYGLAYGPVAQKSLCDWLEKFITQTITYKDVFSRRHSIVLSPEKVDGYGPEGISEPSSSTQSDNHKTCEPSTSEQPDDNTCEPIASTSKSDFVLENTVMTELNCRSSINESSKNNTLDSIRPFPVLQPKTDNKRGRKKGKSCIFTSTPEMKRIQEEENIKQSKRREQELKRAKTVKRQLVKKTKALGVTTKKNSEYGDVNELLDDECIEVEDFVLVKFPTKKKVVYYVGIIEEISGNELAVNFLRFKENCGFYYPVTKDISLIVREDIVAKLPPPTRNQGTTRQSSYLKFNVSFLNYNIQ
ncbi:hypothetical protein JTB14_035511 [Gonioctena quinquepunctata]|nr:hypothetical protein JTB14_035511 [Gonioctena quinquepunctata]